MTTTRSRPTLGDGWKGGDPTPVPDQIMTDSRQSPHPNPTPERGPIRALFLDDSPERWQKFQAGWVGGSSIWAKSAASCVGLLERESDFDIIFLDHDLEPSHYDNAENRTMARTGESVARWMVVHREDFRPDLWVIIHSLNPSGSTRIHLILNQVPTWQVKVDPFGWTRADRYLHWQRRYQESPISIL